MDALVLAAGLGTRLGPRTQRTPKCLVQVGGRPIIECVLEKLSPLPISYIGVTTFHFKQQVVEHFGKHSDERIRVIVEERLLGTGGGIRNALAAMPPFTCLLVHNCDIVSDIDLAALVAAHQASGADATMAVRRRTMPRSLAFGVDGLLISRSRDLPAERLRESILAEFCGVHLFGARMASFIRGSDSECLIDLLVQASANGLGIRAFDIGAAWWQDLGTPESLAAYEHSIMMAQSPAPADFGTC